MPPRPEPKSSGGGRAPRKDSLPEQQGVVGAKEAMAAFVQKNIEQGALEGARADKRAKLDEEKFKHDVTKHNAAVAQQAARDALGAVRDERQQVLEEQRLQIEKDRLANETSFNNEKLKADSKRAADEHALAVMREENRFKESKAQSDSVAAQTAMMMKLVETLGSKLN